MKIPDKLRHLLDEGVIDDVLERLLSGKEAAVFVVEKDDDVLAAKVYKGRDERTFKNVSSYLDGRAQSRNTRDRRAMAKGRSRYGQQKLEEQWREAEYLALQRAFAAGVRVPRPHLLYEDVLLMELVLDDDGHPAPRLADLDLDAEVARLLHEEAFSLVRRLLAEGLVHGDLSAFNVLLGHEGLTLIDLPQVVEAAGNREAKELLHRDLRNLTEHLARFDAGLLRFVDCGEGLWHHFERGSLDRVDGPAAALPPARRGKAGRGRRGRNPGAGADGTGPADRADRPRESGRDRGSEGPVPDGRRPGRGPRSSSPPGERSEGRGRGGEGRAPDGGRSGRGSRPAQTSDRRPGDSRGRERGKRGRGPDERGSAPAPRGKPGASDADAPPPHGRSKRGGKPNGPVVERLPQAPPGNARRGRGHRGPPSGGRDR